MAAPQRAHIRTYQPLGQALIVRPPDGMPVDYAEKVARVLLDRQPRWRFPCIQEFDQTEDGQLVIFSVVHDVFEIQRFTGKLHRTWRRAMSWQRFVWLLPGRRQYKRGC